MTSERSAEIKVRQASLCDAASVLTCLAAAFEPYRESYTPDGFRDTVPPLLDLERRFQEMVVLVAEADSGEVVGTMAYQVVPGSGEGHLRGMAVHPRVQGKGIATRLLATAERDLCELGCAQVTLDTTEPLHNAIRFYRRHGYEPTGVVNDFFGMPLLEFAKSLG